MAQIPNAELIMVEVGEIKPQKWEYLVTWLTYHDDDKNLAELGQFGWELVAIIADGESIRAYLKRPIWNPE